MAVRFFRRKGVVSNPCIDCARADVKREAGAAIALVEVANDDGVTTGGTQESEGCRARRRASTRDRLAVTGRLPRGYVDRHVAGQEHGIRFVSEREMTDPVLPVRNPRCLEEPAVDRIAPDDGVSGLVEEMRGDSLEALIVDEPLQLTPAALEAGGFFGALIVDVVDVLDDGL